MSKKAKLRLVVYIVTSLLMSLAVMLIITAVSLIILFSTPDKLRGDFTVTIDDTDDDTKPFLVKDIDVNTLYRQGNWYVNFNDISDIYGFSVSGDRLHLRYIFRNETDDVMYVNFETDTLTLNGVSIVREIPDMDSNGCVYLPIDVLNTFFEGLEISYDSEEKIVLIECGEYCFLNVRSQETTLKIDIAQMP